MLIQFTAKKSDKIHHTISVPPKKCNLTFKGFRFQCQDFFLSLLNNQICHHRSFLFYDLLPLLSSSSAFCLVCLLRNKTEFLLYIDRKFPILAFTQVPFNFLQRRFFKNRNAANEEEEVPWHEIHNDYS